MRAFRSPSCLIGLVVLVTVLALDGCSSADAPQSALLHPQAPRHVRPPATAVPTVAPTDTPDPSANPARLVIPALGIKAHVESVGILANGDLATPTQHPWDDVGWYSAGQQPGERGSAVIDGHLDRPGGYPAVFWSLRDLHAGDAVLVVMDDGKMLRFSVTRVAFYPPQAAPLQDIFGNNGGRYLNLITCAGDWIPSQHQTTLRLVVYTTL
jgi:sortase (surface protein transpeptidase)